LELRDPSLDNSLAAAWGVSLGNPTPAAANSILGQDEPAPITDIIVTPGTVLPGQAFNVTATISGATTATLIYKVGFSGAEQSVLMTNVGNIWTAEVPGQEVGQLVRYRIESDVAVAPFNDSINYFGLVVAPTNIVDNALPVVQFWVDEAQFLELTTTDLALTNTKIPAVLAFNNQVFDNATVRVRGGDFSRANYPKKSLKFELPSGYGIDIGGEGSYLIDEFGMNADFGDWSVVTPDLSWDVFNAETDSFTSSFFMHVQRNSNFHGIFRFQELYDGAWREANGFNGEDEFFQAEGNGFGFDPGFDKEAPDDGDLSSILPLNEVLQSPPSATKTAYLYRNIDIPNMINHMALSSLMRHHDQSGQNFYMWLDSDTQVWSIVEWDLDRTWVINEDNPDGFTTPTPINSELLNAIWEVPEFRDMYWRRMQTLVDKYLSDDQLIVRHEELLQEIGATNSTLEFAKWNRNDVYANRFWQVEFNEAIQLRRDAYAAEARMPGTASGNFNIVINELHYNPLDGDAEFVELYNNSNESVDLSGWTIDAVGLKVAFGTVILPGQSLVFTDNLIRFKSQYAGNVLVGGQYSGGLNGGGESVRLLDSAGNVMDEVVYSDRGEWPTAPDGTGFTLALVNPSLDNSLASSWAASLQTNGSPGRPNDVIIEPNTIKIFAAGQTGNEVVSLEIAGQNVATYLLSNFGGQANDLANRNFVELIYVSPTPVNLSDVRINFINDTFDQATNTDYNVAIDRLEIDLLVYETEAANVYSTGTYLSEDGLVPGFRRSEILHANGFFQYGVPNTNRAPVASADVVTTGVGQAIAINVLSNDRDLDPGDTISIDSFTQAANGAVALVGNTLVYTPNSGFVGSDLFSYTIVDASGATATASVSITVDPAVTNVVKIFAAGATGNEIITLELSGQVVGTYRLTDFGGQAGDLDSRNFVALTYASPTPVNIGDVRINFTNDVYDTVNGIDYNVAIDRIEIGTLVYQTEAADVFSTGTWLAADGIVPGFRASEVLHTNGYFQYGVVDTNEAPIATADSTSTSAGLSVTINVLANDSDPDLGDSISIDNFTQAANGRVDLAGTALVYTPNAGFAGTDLFSYTISDSIGALATATVEVTVTAPPPVIATGNIVRLLNAADNAWLRGNSNSAQTTTVNDTRTHWQLISAGSDSYRLRNVQSGLYLDGDLLSVDLNSSATATGTEWRFVPAANGGYYLFNVAYNRYLDSNGRNASVAWDPGTLETDDIWNVTLV
ncbi:MAG: tandem-95 repeat protein, partial [Pirellulaceae bacterium]|nr:tandem-95 repeat protein [Pirellulaceae bacterium]